MAAGLQVFIYDGARQKPLPYEINPCISLSNMIKSRTIPRIFIRFYLEVSMDSAALAELLFPDITATPEDMERRFPARWDENEYYVQY